MGQEVKTVDKSTIERIDTLSRAALGASIPKGATVEIGASIGFDAGRRAFSPTRYYVTLRLPGAVGTYEFRRGLLQVMAGVSDIARGDHGLTVGTVVYSTREDADPDVRAEAKRVFDSLADAMRPVY